jgi:endonuclease YncB( thermonuclease family)
MVEVDGKQLDEILVSKGLARPKGVAVNLPHGERARDKFDKLRQLEGEAKAKGAGIWARPAPSAGAGSAR